MKRSKAPLKKKKTSKKYKTKIPRLFAKNVSRGSKNETKTIDNTFDVLTNAYSVVGYTADTGYGYGRGAIPITASISNKQCLNIIRDGVGLSQRIGARISMKSLRMKFSMTMNEATSIAEYPGAYRVLLVYDRQPNNAGYVNINDLIKSVDQNTTTASDTSTQLFGGLSPKYVERFIVLRDILKYKPASTPTGTVNQFIYKTPFSTENSTYVIDEYVDLKGLETIYRSEPIAGAGDPPVYPAGTIDWIQTGALVLYVYADVSAGGGNSFALRGYTRLRYKDN